MTVIMVPCVVLRKCWISQLRSHVRDRICKVCRIVDYGRTACTHQCQEFGVKDRICDAFLFLTPYSKSEDLGNFCTSGSQRDVTSKALVQTLLANSCWQSRKWQSNSTEVIVE